MQTPIFKKNDLVWLAGFIDGEGYIGITSQQKKESSNSAASMVYHPLLIVTNTNLEALNTILVMIGEGKIYKLSYSNGNHQSAYQYKLTKHTHLVGLLERIRPHLRIKQQQCDIVIDFIKRRGSSVRKTGRGSRGSSSFTLQDQQAYRQLLDLNKRGRSV